MWAGAIDNLGGDVLAWMLSTMKQWGTVASVGLAADAKLNTTVMPFILRGVHLLGVNSSEGADADAAEAVGPARRRSGSRRACSEGRARSTSTSCRRTSTPFSRA